MLLPVALILAVGIALLLVGAGLVTRWGSSWGSTPAERAAPMPGDRFFTGGPAQVRMTRAIDIEAAPPVVWPWLAQMGRGAGWYSWDRLDNGSRKSALHIVSWIPEPQLGDATAIGYLRDLEPGRRMIWWAPGVRYFGAEASLAVDIRLEQQNSGSRLIVRMSADASGLTGPAALAVFRFIDSIMATRQLARFRTCAETYATRAENPDDPETGDRAQYQLYQVVFASNEWAGIRGKELAARWRRRAIEAGLGTSTGVEST